MVVKIFTTFFKQLFQKLFSFKKWFFSRSLIVKLFFVLVITGLGWLLVSRLSPAQEAKPEYQTSVVEKGTLVVSTSASGQVSTANSAEVTTQASGVVKQLFVKDGESVTVGQVIAELELDQLAQQKYASTLASYQGAQNNLASARTNLHTLQSRLFNANQKFIDDAVARELPETDPTYIQQNADWLAAEETYQQQTAIINQAQTSLNSAWLSLQQASPKIYAPISGRITGLSLQEGAVVSAQSSGTGTGSTEKIASIQTDAFPTITINLTEIDIAKVSVGNKATIMLDTYVDKTFSGRVVSVDTIGSVTSGVTNYPVVIQLDTKAGGIFPNMAATANIITDTKDNALLVPASSIVTQEGASMVRVLVNEELQLAPVEIGLAGETQIEIISGLKEGDTVVTSVISPTNDTQSLPEQSPFSNFGAVGGGSGGMRVAR